MTTKTRGRTECNRCGHVDTYDKMLHAKVTGKHYCRDFGPCDRRRAKLIREGKP